MPKNFIHELAKSITDHLPEGIKSAHSEVERVVRDGVEQALGAVRFVREDEFELQRKILLKTRKKVDQLEKQMRALEEKLAAAGILSEHIDE